MVGYKEKKIKQTHIPQSPAAINIQNPNTINNTKPSWCFRTYDNEIWNFNADNFMKEILPKLKEWESQTWHEILLNAKKQNHSIDTQNLNKIARDRLINLRIEANAVISLRIQATHRLYGYKIGSVFYILWYDNNHGDNDNCVCKSRKKHT